jgi:thymidylate synthase ThyX
MKVNLINYTQDALNLLLFTKNTRLQSAAEGVADWDDDKKAAELKYMLGTIKSSWEFVDYVFEITGVSRAFTHQLVRTRSASYAQQSQRTVNMSDFEYVDTTGGNAIYKDLMGYLSDGYEALIEDGVPPQDARGILPTNIKTSIIAKFNLRTLHDMAMLRLCTRTQGEYQRVFRAMRRAVVNVHPWTEPFIRVYCAWHGSCAFPNYHECPIKNFTYNPDTTTSWDGKEPLTRDAIHNIWENINYEAIPKQR